MGAVIEITGDLLKQPFPAIGHGVNCQGVMGAGIAKAFADKWPELEMAYKIKCGRGEIVPGTVYPFQVKDGPLVLNLASQNMPGPDAKLQWLESAYGHALDILLSKGIDTFGLPLIGCGIGGLKEEDVLYSLRQITSVYSNLGFTLVVVRYG